MTDVNYEENWQIYFTLLNNEKFCSILVDLGLNEIAPDKTRPFLITTTTFMNNPAKDGYSSEDENDTLNQIEDCLIRLFISKYKVIYAGRLKSDGKIQSCFYSDRKNKIESIISEVNEKYPNYRFEYKCAEEKGWKTYFEILYPSPIQQQRIGNAQVIENLEEHGDQLERERPVDHWIYFNSEKDREKFLDAIENQGFNIVDKEETKSEDYPFALQLTRVDKVDHQSVDDYVIDLWGKAQKFNGNYDGWETFIIKD